MAAPRDVTVRASLDPSKYTAGAERVSWQTKQMLRQQEAAERQWRAMQRAHGEALRENERREREIYLAHDAALRENQRREEEAARAAADALETASQRKRQAMETTGKVMLTTGGAILTGLALTTKAATDWESAWTGVLKTVEGSDAELAAIEDGLRGLATELPATHQEIAAVAEAAGQLGISTGGIVGFTRTMIDLGETTNLSADEAATTLARFANIAGTSEGQISNLGSTLVGLGNNFATTEAEIAALGMRLAGAGVQANMTEGDILGIAAAMSSVGIEAEAGGTAMSTTITKIGTEVDTNGPKLEMFARVAGMSAQEFARAWRTDAAGALTAFVGGLADTSELGMSTNQVLTELGITGMREADTLRRLSSAQEVLNEALATGNEAFDENSALVEEAAKRYETAEAKIQIAKNAILDASIGIGETFLPMLASAAEGVAGLAESFGNLPEPMQRTIAVLGAVAGVAGTLGGATLLLLPRIMDTRKALRDLAEVSPRVATAMSRVERTSARVAPVMGRVARGAGAAGVALTALAAASELVGDEDVSVSQYTKALLDLANTGQGIDLSFGTDLADAFERIANPNALQRLDDWSGKITQIFGIKSDAQRFAEDFEHIGQALASVYQSNPTEATRLFNEVLEQTGGTAEELLELMPAYRDALTDTDNAQRLGGESASALAAGLGEVDPAMEAATQAAEEFVERATGAFESFIDPGGAFQTAIDKQREQAETAAAESESSKDSWEDFYDGTSVSAEQYIASLEQQVKAQEAWAANMEALSARVNERLPADMRDTANAMIDELLDLGPEGAAQVQLLHDMSDAELRKVVELYGRKGDSSSREFADGVNRHRPDPIPVRADGAPARREGESTKQYLDRIHAELKVGADTSSAIASAQAAQRYINGLNATIKGYHVSTGLPSSRSGGNTMATGGPVIGPGTGTSDDVPAWLSNGEHVWTAAEVQALGGHGAVLKLRQAALAGDVPRFAAGGAVGLTRATSFPSSVSATLGSGALASAFDGVALTLEVDGQPVRAIVRAEALDVVVGGVSHEVRGQRRGGRYARE